MLAGGELPGERGVLVEPSRAVHRQHQSPDVNLANERDRRFGRDGAVVKEELKSSRPRTLLRGLGSRRCRDRDPSFLPKGGITARERRRALPRVTWPLTGRPRKIDACKTRLDEDVTNLSAFADIIAPTSPPPGRRGPNSPGAPGSSSGYASPGAWSASGQ
jgi:hypothetical protein